MRRLFRIFTVLSPLPFVVLPVTALAQIHQPVLGMMRDGNSALRPVYGVAASATLGDPVTENVDTFACSNARCFLQSAGTVLTLDADGLRSIADAANGPLALTNEGALLYSSQTGELLRWAPATGWTASAFAIDGLVLSLRSAGGGIGDGIDVALRRDGGLWLEHYSADGSASVFAAVAEDSEQPIHAVHLMESGYLIATEHTVTLVRTDGSTQEFPAEGVRAFFAMADSSIEAVSSQGNWILHLGDSPSWNLLPGVEPLATTAVAVVAQ
ncbi:MAG: hypothetical protein ABL995_02505 [Bryobacteraceae bacterium]